MERKSINCKENSKNNSYYTVYWKIKLHLETSGTRNNAFCFRIMNSREFVTRYNVLNYKI